MSNTKIYSIYRHNINIFLIIIIIINFYQEFFFFFFSFVFHLIFVSGNGERWMKYEFVIMKPREFKMSNENYLDLII
jgi:hypothetical protein